MNLDEQIHSAMIAIIDQYLSQLSLQGKSMKESMNTVIIPAIANHLRPLGGKILTEEDFVYLEKVTNSLPSSKNVQKILKEYNQSISSIMEGDNNESD